MGRQWTLLTKSCTPGIPCTQKLSQSLFSICCRRASCSKLWEVSQRRIVLPYCSHLCVYLLLSKCFIQWSILPSRNSRARCFQFVIVAPPTKTCSSQLDRSLALFGSCTMRPGVIIFELRWPARIPLARPGRAGHDGKTSWHSSNHNGVCRELAKPAINTKTCSSRMQAVACFDSWSRRRAVIFES